MSSSDKPAQPITQQQLADLAGVSRLTVNKALQDDTEVHAETRRRVHELAERHGYRPSAAARIMRTQQTHQIGVLLQNAPGNWLHHTAVFEMCMGINDQLEAAGYVLSLVRLEDIEENPPRSRVFRERMLDGMIVIDSLPDHVYEKVRTMMRHCVWLETRHWEPTCCVRRDERHAARLAAEKLIGLGYRRLRWVVPPFYESHPLAHYSLAQRREAVEQACARHDVELHRLELSPDPVPHELDALARNLQPDAALLAYDFGTAGRIAHLASRMRLAAGPDFGLASCDNIQGRERAFPGLCRVDFDRVRLGRLAAQMILRLLDGESPQQHCRSRRLRDRWMIGDTAWGPPDCRHQIVRPMTASP